MKENKKYETLALAVTASEKKQTQQKSKKLGFRSTSAYIRDLILKDLEQ